MNRITEIFTNEKRQFKFAPFLVIGDPDPERFITLVKALEPYADVLEFGIPFSDPIADGPTIQRANQRSLDQGITRSKALELIKEIRSFTEKPIVILTYGNIIGAPPHHKENLQKFKEAGIDGVIIADFPLEEISRISSDLEKEQISLINLITPTMTPERFRAYLPYSSGYLYLVAVKGTTGEQTEVKEYTKQALMHFQQETDQKLPILVGFGISTPDHAKIMVDSGADGVIVGSAIINIIEENLNAAEKMQQEIKEFAAAIRTALDNYNQPQR